MLSPGLRHMALSAILFSFLGLFVRFVPRIPFLEIVVFRAIVSLVMGVVWLRYRRKPILGRNHFWLTVRGTAGFFGLTLYVFTLQRMPLAEAVTIQYTNPLFTALFAPLFLKEKWRGDEWLAALVAFGGVVVLANPGASAQWWVALLGLLGAMCAGFAYNVVRKLGLAGEEPMSVVLYLPLVAFVVGLPLSVPVWKTPSGGELALLLGIGLASSLAQLELTKGLRLERAAKATVVNYLVIVLSTIYSLVLGDPFTGRSALGMGLILLSLLMLSRRPPLVTET